MTLRNLLRTLDPNLLVEIQSVRKLPIITTRAKSWKCLDNNLLSTYVDTIGGASERNHDGAVVIVLATEIPVYVSNIDELQSAMDDSKVSSIALAADIIANDDMATLLTFDTAEIKTLDLNGFMLAATNVEYSETVSAIKVMGGGTLNIYDSQGCGEVFGGKYADCNYALWVADNSMVNIYGGYFTVASMGENAVTSSAVYAQDGHVNIYGGWFENESYNYDSRNVLAGNVSCYGGVVIGQTPKDFLAVGKRIVESERYYDHLYRVVGK